MTLTQILIVLRARWFSAVLVLLAVVALVMVVTLALPKRYTAVASVVLDVKSTDPIAGMVMPGMNVSGYMATQAEVLRSERVALRALQDLRLHESRVQRAAWQRATEGQGDFRAWLADTLTANLEVKPAREANVINVWYTASDPVLAAGVANAVVKAYTDTTLELQVGQAKRYNSFFDERAKELREALEQAQARLSAYNRSKGIIVNDERLDVENSRLSELSSQLVTLQALATESGSRKQQAGRKPSQMPEVLGSPLLAGLVAELSRQESKLREASERLGDEHPNVQQLRAGIDTLRSRIDGETRRVTDSLAVTDSVNQTRLAQVRASLDEQRAKLLHLKSQRDEAAVLLRDVENAQKAYDSVLARVSQTSTESQNTQTNVSVLKQATVPMFTSSPRLLLNLGIGVVLGLLLAIGATIVRESRDRRLRSEEDVTLLLKQPLFGVLPARSRLALLGQSRARLTKLRLLAALPHPPRLAK